MKKLFAVLMTLALVLSMGTIALAAGEGESTTTGTITISNAVEGAEYKIYKMFDFTPANDDGTQGRYTASNNAWRQWVNGSGDGGIWLIFDEEAGTIDFRDEYKEIDANGNKVPTASAVADVADDAKYYINANDTITETAKATAGADGEVTFEGLELGYYFIDSSLGTICALTNTNSTYTQVEKNEKPDITKVVQEDFDDSWGNINDADIGQTVNYKSTITVGVGATNYVMHDTMDPGLTFNNDVVVKLADGTEVEASNYTVTYPATDDHTFDVAFYNNFIKGLAKGTQFTVYYSATLNENATVASTGNSNKVYLSYGEDNTWNTTTSETKTYTWKMDVLKFTMDGENKAPLAGATFELLSNNTAIKFTEVTGDDITVPTYIVDPNGTVTEITTDENGKFEIIGLDEGTYALNETEAPAGYNKLSAPVSVVITSTHNDAELTASYKINDADPATIEVENKTGGLLPETGGIGTTIFYIVGGILMVAAVVFLITKKRMSAFA